MATLAEQEATFTVLTCLQQMSQQQQHPGRQSQCFVYTLPSGVEGTWMPNLLSVVALSFTFVFCFSVQGFSVLLWSMSWNSLCRRGWPASVSPVLGLTEKSVKQKRNVKAVAIEYLSYFFCRCQMWKSVTLLPLHIDRNISHSLPAGVCCIGTTMD